jgi:uncharacterized protein YjbI with pentapeptide repeats
MEVLSAYVRGNARIVQTRDEIKEAADTTQRLLKRGFVWPNKCVSQPGTKIVAPRLDIQAALTVVGRREKREEPGRIDPGQTGLPRANLLNASLEGANLRGPDLEGKNLTKKQLARAIIDEKTNLPDWTT